MRCRNGEAGRGGDRRKRKRKEKGKKRKEKRGRRDRSTTAVDHEAHTYHISIPPEDVGELLSETAALPRKPRAGGNRLDTVRGNLVSPE